MLKFYFCRAKRLSAMKINEIRLIYFSPTHTSRRIAEAIAQGISEDKDKVLQLDLTLHGSERVVVPSTALAVIAIPVYGGRVAPLAMKRLEAVHGKSTPAVLVAIYGNRDYERALAELGDYAIAHGFSVIAGATFVGEHSYCTQDYPIAPGRPDADDLRIARLFGKRIKEKTERAVAANALSTVDVRNMPKLAQPSGAVEAFVTNVSQMTQNKTGKSPVPIADGDLCIHCGQCAANCPTGAILSGDELNTDAGKCIKCCACVKCCPTHARTYGTPFAPLLSTYFQEPKSPQTIL